MNDLILVLFSIPKGRCRGNQFVQSNQSNPYNWVHVRFAKWRRTTINASRDAEPLKLHSGSGSGSGPAQQAKTNTTRLRLSTRCFPGGRILCTNWLHTGADLIQAIVSYVRIKTRTLKKFFRATLTRRPYLMHYENSHLCERREIPTFEGN